MPTALNASGGIKNPAKAIPRGLLLGIIGILLLYVTLQLVAQGTLGPALASNTVAPLTAVATAVFGGWGGQLLLFGMIISIFGCLSGDVLNTPRVIFAAARDGLLPASWPGFTPNITRHVSPSCFTRLQAAPSH